MHSGFILWNSLLRVDLNTTSIPQCISYINLLRVLKQVFDAGKSNKSNKSYVLLVGKWKRGREIVLNPYLSIE